LCPQDFIKNLKLFQQRKDRANSLFFVKNAGI
jgi:hypothetical protein